MSRLYFYPKMDYQQGETKNPYVKDFENALSVHHEVINKKFNSTGVLDLFKYLFKADIYLFNWIEEIPRRRLGKFQVPIFVFFLLTTKLFRIKVIWVLHNKYSHNLAKNKWSDFMYHLMMKNSDLILTHSSNGIEFGKKRYPKAVKKIKYEIHPIKSRLNAEYAEKKYDFIFWGSIQPYKGIVRFLKFVKERKDTSTIKILIIGNCLDVDYKKQIESYVCSNITYKEKFYSFEDIGKFAAQSKYILFTYSRSSVLSSGALMDSMRMNCRVIGPNYGAFQDLSYLTMVNTYNDFEDVLKILSLDQLQPIDNTELDIFFKENSWLAFAHKLNVYTSELLLKR